MYVVVSELSRILSDERVAVKQGVHRRAVATVQILKFDRSSVNRELLACLTLFLLQSLSTATNDSGLVRLVTRKQPGSGRD